MIFGACNLGAAACFVVLCAPGAAAAQLEDGVAGFPGARGEFPVVSGPERCHKEACICL